LSCSGVLPAYLIAEAFSYIGKETRAVTG